MRINLDINGLSMKKHFIGYTVFIVIVAFVMQNVVLSASGTDHLAKSSIFEEPAKGNKPQLKNPGRRRFIIGGALALASGTGAVLSYLGRTDPRWEKLDPKFKEFLKILDALESKMPNKKYKTHFEIIREQVLSGRAGMNPDLDNAVLMYDYENDRLTINNGIFLQSSAEEVAGFGRQSEQFAWLAIPIVHEANHILRAKGIISLGADRAVTNFMIEKGIFPAIRSFDEEIKTMITRGEPTLETYTGASKTSLPLTGKNVPVDLLWRIMAHADVMSEYYAMVEAQIKLWEEIFGVKLTSENYYKFYRYGIYANLFSGVFDSNGNINENRLKRNLFVYYIRNPAVRLHALVCEHARGTIKIKNIEIYGPTSKSSGGGFSLRLRQLREGEVEYVVLDNDRFMDWLNDDGVYRQFAAVFPDFDYGARIKTSFHPAFRLPLALGIDSAL